jgi:hypothetical protein
MNSLLDSKYHDLIYEGLMLLMLIINIENTDFSDVIDQINTLDSVTEILHAKNMDINCLELAIKLLDVIFSQNRITNSSYITEEFDQKGGFAALQDLINTPNTSLTYLIENLVKKHYNIEPSIYEEIKETDDDKNEFYSQTNID